MRTLYESLLDINDVETSVEQFLMVDKWCKDNIRGLYEIDEKTLTINSPGGIVITNRELVEFPSYIHFGTVYDFNCNNCPSLKSLKGAPKKVGSSFSCNNCPSLKSLKGAPKEVAHGFSCNDCTSLKSLEGAPKKVGISFSCKGCTSLKSLDGAPVHTGCKIYSDIQ